MPNLPTWKLPATLQPLTAEAYAGLVVLIDIGCKAVALNDKRVAEGCKGGCMPLTKPRLGDMAATIYNYLPASSLPLGEVQLTPGMAPPLEDSDRASHYTFRFGRAKLLAVLEEHTSAEVKAELGDVSPGLDPETGPGWWGVALAAGGVLFWLAKRNFYIAAGSRLLPYVVPLSRFLAHALQAALVAGVILELPAGAKWIFKEVLNPLIKPAANAIGWALGALVLVAGGVVIYKVASKPKRALPSSNPHGALP